MADFDPAWAAGGTRRAPTTAEQSLGFACGPADPSLFNFIFHRMQSELAGIIAEGDAAPSDAILNQAALAIYDMIRAQAPRLISADMTLTVNPGAPASATNFLTMQAAFDSLANAIIMPDVVVTISLSGDVHTVTETVYVDHINASRIHLIGANLPGAFPVYADIHSVLATARTNLRAKVPTVISIQGVNGLYVRQGGLGKIKNIMFDHNGANTTPQGCLVAVGGTVFVEDCVFFGCNLSGAENGAGIAGNGKGEVYVSNFLIAHCDEGARAHGRSYIQLDGPSSPLSPIARMSTYGIVARSGGEIRLRYASVSDLAGYGAYCDTGGLIVIDRAATFGNCGNNLGANGGRIFAPGLPFLGAPTVTQSLVANDGGYIQAQLAVGSSVTCSPIEETVGNHNSYIRII